MENIEPIQELRDYNFIFVMGVAHSGTTILYRLLARHPKLCWFSQFSQRSGGIPKRTDIPGSNFLNYFGREIFSIPWRKKKDLSLYFVPRPMEAHKIWDYLLPEKLVEKENLSKGEVSNMKNRFKQIFSSELNQWGRKSIICKLPRLLQATEILYNLFSSVKIIHLTRDGRAVALSNIDKFGSDQDGRLKKLERSARHWKSEIDYMLETKERVDPEDFLEVKLEQLQRHFRDKFSQLFDFLNFKFEQYPTPLPDLRTNTNKKYQQQVSRKEIEKIEQILNPELNALGYGESWLT